MTTCFSNQLPRPDGGKRQERLEPTSSTPLHAIPDETWISTGSISYSELGGFAGFRLLLEEEPAFLESLDEAVWKRWAPSILAYLTLDNDDETTALHRKLIALAYQHAPREILATLDRVITSENDRLGHIFVLSRLAGCWDSTISGILLRRAAKLDVKPRCLGDLLSPLLERQDSDATALATSLVADPPSQEEPDRAYSIEAAVQLLARRPDTIWEVFWKASTADPTWARRVFEELCQRSEGGRLVQQLDEARAGCLLDWLLCHSPHDSDPTTESAFKGADDIVRRWRDGLIYRLRDWGTAGALAEIERLKAAHPELHWLDWTALIASKIRQKRAWRPATPRQIIEMAQDRRRRFVAAGPQLLDVLSESLERLQAKLSGETPRARLLWDTTVQRPKDEEDLSDFIKNHLEDDLVARDIVVGREVKIRRRNWTDGTAGQLTDIHVDAESADPSFGSSDRIRAIIEVKGCWHPELKTAMETQLLQRYLTQNQCQHGLYAVGWFLCDYWKDDYDRKARAASAFGSIEECRTFLDAQAQRLSASPSSNGRKIRTTVLDYRLP